jgi:hypothetical protein
MAKGEALRTAGCCITYESSKLFIARPSDKLCRDLMAVHRKQCRLVTGYRTLRQHLHIMGLSESAKSIKCGGGGGIFLSDRTHAVSAQHWLGIKR